MGEALVYAYLLCIPAKSGWQNLGAGAAHLLLFPSSGSAEVIPDCSMTSRQHGLLKSLLSRIHFCRKSVSNSCVQLN